MRVAICQVNPTVGDLRGNAELIGRSLAQAETAGAQVAVLPELALTGYPPEDLVLRRGFVCAARRVLEELAGAAGDCAAVIGFVDGSGESARAVPDIAGVSSFSDAYNAVAVCAGGELRGVYRKRHLPNYDVFDEVRHFRRGDEPLPLFDISGAAVGITLCEDAWVDDGPVAQLAGAGARLVLNVNGSPFRVGKQAVREAVIGRRAAESSVPIVYVNLVGGQDELVFDGGSFAVDADGSVAARCVSFAETVDVLDVALAPHKPLDASQADLIRVTASTAPQEPPSQDPQRFAAVSREGLSDADAQRWAALVLATRDYVRKSGFVDVAVGLSGGVDSSLVAAIAADALGAERVHGVLMPSRHSSSHSVADAEKLAANLGIDSRIIGIERAHTAVTEILAQSAGGHDLRTGGLADQNIQARLRGIALMALANEHGWLVLTTGNKSELAVGYSTLYGDTAGAFAVISDLWKLDVYSLCRWRNEQPGAALIPEAVLSKAPSAELAPGQRDDQSLPAYEILDPILRLYVEELQSAEEIQESTGAPSELVEDVCAMVDNAEYKRRQTPIGPRLSQRAFGRDRRMPIVNRFRSHGWR